jgi:hypothetical protein
MIPQEGEKARVLEKTYEAFSTNKPGKEVSILLFA